MSLTEMIEEFQNINGRTAPLPTYIYDFLFKYYSDPMDEHDPMDVVDCLITERIYSKESNLPTDIITFDYGGDGFTRYEIPMVVVDGRRKEYWWNCMVPVSIAEDPKILISDELLEKRSNMTKDEWDKILRFISINHELLLALWDCKTEEIYGLEWRRAYKLLKTE